MPGPSFILPTRSPVLRRLAWTATAAILPLILLSCATEEKSDLNAGLADVIRGPDIQVSIPADEPIVVGVSTALTGPSGGRGRQYRDAVVVAVERWKALNGSQIAGHDIMVAAEDDGCSEQDVARLAAQRLISRPGLVGVLGPQCSSGTEAGIPVFANAGVVVISGSATASALAEVQPGEGFFLRTAYRNDQQGSLAGLYMLGFIESEQLTSPYAYLIDDSETYGLDLINSTEAFLLEQHVRLSRGSVQRGAVDFSQITAEVAGANPDAVFFGGYNPEAGLLLRQLRDTGWTGRYLAGDAVCGASDCEFLVALGDLAEGSVFSGCSPPMTEDFMEEFEAIRIDRGVELNESAPTAAFVTHYADAATILLNAVRGVAERQNDGSIRFNPKDLRDSVRSSSLPDGLSGQVTFNSDGDRKLWERGSEDLRVLARDLGLVPCRVENGAIAYFE